MWYSTASEFGQRDVNRLYPRRDTAQPCPQSLESPDDQHGPVGLRGQHGRIGNRRHGRAVHDDPVVSFAKLLEQRRELLALQQLGGVRGDRPGRQHAEILDVRRHQLIGENAPVQQRDGEPGPTS